MRRRESFDEVADLYAGARPGYPNELIADLAGLSALEATHRILEIGAGTGQLTVPLAEYGVSLVAVELGHKLADRLSRNLARFARTEVIVADFEEWIPPAISFDLVVAATAFHWLDPATRVQKCVNLLRPAGTLAIVETHWGAGARNDRFQRESQSCYAQWDPYHDPGFRPRTYEDLPERREELETSGFFDSIIHRRYICERRYSAGEYRDLLSTFSDVRGLEERNREGFLACISRLIEDRFEGRIVRQDLYDLWLAHAVA